MEEKTGRNAEVVEAAMTRVCHAYLHEIVVLANGDVTTCCYDGLGQNKLENVNRMPLEQIWTEKFIPWHAENLKSNALRNPWKSAFCNDCIDRKIMVPFNAVKTADPELINFFNEENPPFPGSLVIEPTSSCNYSCWGCYTGIGENKSNIKVLRKEVFTRHILPVIPELWQIRLYNFGEPFLHPDIKEFIAMIRGANSKVRIDISTNGMLMDPEASEVIVDSQVNYLSVSLHGGHTQQGLLNYARRGPDIDVITSNIRALVEAKRRKNSKLPWIYLKALLFDWNDSEEEMRDYLEFGKDLGADFTGWDLNTAGEHTSKRVAPGTEAYAMLEKNHLLLQDFYRLPAWP